MLHACMQGWYWFIHPENIHSDKSKFYLEKTFFFPIFSGFRFSQPCMHVILLIELRANCWHIVMIVSDILCVHSYTWLQQTLNTWSTYVCRIFMVCWSYTNIWRMIQPLLIRPRRLNKFKNFSSGKQESSCPVRHLQRI